jgi:hypothetical protein
MPDPVVPPPSLPGNLSPVVPVLSRRGVFKPVIGGRVIIALPGERVESKVLEIISDNAAVVEITGLTTSKYQHNWAKGSKLAIQRVYNDLGEQWEPIDDRSVREQEAIDRARDQLRAQEPPKPEDEDADDVERMDG